MKQSKGMKVFGMSTNEYRSLLMRESFNILVANDGYMEDVSQNLADAVEAKIGLTPEQLSVYKKGSDKKTYFLEEVEWAWTDLTRIGLIEVPKTDGRKIKGARKVTEAGWAVARKQVDLNSISKHGILIDDVLVKGGDAILKALGTDSKPTSSKHPKPRRYKAWKSDLYRAQDGICYGCGDKFNEGQMHIDHKIPVSRDGTDHYDNLQLLCVECNGAKGSKTMEEWKGTDHIKQIVEWHADHDSKYMLTEHAKKLAKSK